LHVRILADREPYSSFADQTLPRGESLTVGPPPVGSASPDVVVLPAADFLDLLPIRGRSPGFIAYGPVPLMGCAFERGCVDYLREPWTLAELSARLVRLDICSFSAGGSLFRLEGSSLSGSEASVELGAEERSLLRLLVRNSPFPVTNEAIASALPAGLGPRALAQKVASLRRSLWRLSPDLSRRVRPIRGVGYRMDIDACG